MTKKRILIDSCSAWNVLKKIRFQIKGEYVLLNGKKYITAVLSDEQICELEKNNINIDSFYDNDFD